MTALIASIAAFFVGPAIYRLFRRREGFLQGLDGFVFVSITGIIAVHVLPETIEQGGIASLGFAALGLIGPTFLERLFQRTRRQMHLGALVLGLLGIAIHALFDGVFLGEPPGTHEHDHAGDSLPLAIVLHRLPVGLTIWWLVRREYGMAPALGLLGLLSVSTIIGFAAGPEILQSFSTAGMAWFQSLVAGSLFHVVVHRAHHSEEDGCCGAAPRAAPLHEGLGGLLGIALLVVLFFQVASPGAHAAEDGFSDTFWRLALESAPPLLIGYLAAGILSAFFPRSWFGWLGRGRSWNQAFRGMAIGLPIPVCSCGVVPLYRALIERGVPATAAMAFLVATPELGLDAILLSIPLLGIDFTILRVVAAALLALLVGAVVGRVARNPRRGPAEGTAATHPDRPPAFGVRAKEALRLGFSEMVEHTAPWILFGLLVAAAAAPLLEEGWLTAISPAVQVIAFAILGVPAYVCASGATPLVAVLLVKGVAPGAALAFLLTGPATNVVTFGLLRQLHGKSIALIFSTVMLALSVALGFAANWLFEELALTREQALEDEPATLLQMASLAILALVFLISFVQRGPRRFAGEIISGLDEYAEETPSAARPEEHAHEHQTR